MIKQRYFLHIDADAFFASVEQCLHKELRGQAIVTGRDGSIGVALSYEAKRLGVERAMPIHLIRKAFPSVTMVASDYAMYQLYSDRMIAIVQTFVPTAKRKSIDECAGEITAVVRTFYEAEALAREIKQALEEKLWCTFSVGVAATPLLAKMASGIHKPSGLTVFTKENKTELQAMSIGKVTGLGTRTCARLQADGVTNVQELLLAYPRIAAKYSVVLREIVYELQGIPVVTKERAAIQKSMNRARSFTKTQSRAALYGQAVGNLEQLLRQLRKDKLVARRLMLTLKTVDRAVQQTDILFPLATRDPRHIVSYLETLFQELFQTGVWYRYVGVTLSLLSDESYTQDDLFGAVIAEKKDDALYQAIDALTERAGHVVVLRGSALKRPVRLGAHITPGQYPIVSAHALLPGEAPEKRLRYPFLGLVS